MATMQQERRPQSNHSTIRNPTPSAPTQEDLYPTLPPSYAEATSGTVEDSLTTRRLTLAQSYFDTAKGYVSEALSKDERGERMEALEKYNQVLTSLSLGLGQVRNVTGPAVTELRGKLEKMGKQVKGRMEVLLEQEIHSRQATSTSTSSTTSTSSSPTTSSSSSPAAVSRSPKPVSRTSQTSLTSSTTSRPGVSSVMAESGGRGRESRPREAAKADLVFNIDSGIGLFQVDGQDHVRKYEDVDNLSVFRYHERIKGQPPAFIQCGGFIYPLIPGRSPVLKASENVYMFPDLKGKDGCTVGLTLEGATSEELTELDQLLTVMADMRAPETDLSQSQREQEKEGVRERKREEKKEVKEGVKDEEKPTWGTTIAGGIERGVGIVSKGISMGTEAASSLIAKGATKLRERIEPNEQATEIPESVQKGVHVAKKATGCVVGVSDFLMMSLAKLTVAVGKEVKDAVADTEYMKSREVNPHALEAWKATKSGVKGAATVFGDLERGGSALLSSTFNQTAKTVEHKYGEQAGKVTSDSLDTGRGIAKLTYTYWSWKTWGIQFLGKMGEVIRRDQDKPPTSSSSTSSPSSSVKNSK